MAFTKLGVSLQQLRDVNKLAPAAMVRLPKQFNNVGLRSVNSKLLDYEKNRLAGVFKETPTINTMTKNQILTQVEGIKDMTNRFGKLTENGNMIINPKAHYDLLKPATKETNLSGKGKEALNRVFLAHEADEVKAIPKYLKQKPGEKWNNLSRVGHLDADVILNEHNRLSTLTGVGGADEARKVQDAVRLLRYPTGETMVYDKIFDRLGGYAHGQRVSRHAKKHLGPMLAEVAGIQYTPPVKNTMYGRIKNWLTQKKTDIGLV